MAVPRFDHRAPRYTHLAGLGLLNFRSVLSGQDVPLAPLTVVSGANSTGKSSLLQAVLALSQASKRRIDGDRFPLNDDLTRLGTFTSLRHQLADPNDPVVISTRFVTDRRDMRLARLGRRRAFEPRDPNVQDAPVDVRWSIELDSPVEDQIGSARVSAIEIEVSRRGGSRFSARVERALEQSSVPAFDGPTGESPAFTGELRTDSLETATPVRGIRIHSGAVSDFYGDPPEAEQLVGDWFRELEEQRCEETPPSAADNRPQPRIDITGSGVPELPPESDDAAHDVALTEAAFAILRDLEPFPRFVAWYNSLDPQEHQAAENEVVDRVKQYGRGSKRFYGSSPRLSGRAPDQLLSAQAACTRYLATRVRYVGPLRHSPNQPFATAPDPDAGDVGVSGEHVAAVLQAHRSVKRDYPLPPNSNPGRERVTLEAALNAWLGHLSLAEEVKVREDTPLVLGVSVRPPGLNEPVSLGAVGVGVSQALPVVVQCLVAGPGALVVIEQPELHLHPAAQQMLGDFLIACAKWGQRFLVESHSEYLVSRLRRRIAEDRSDELRQQVAIYFAERDAAGATQFRPVRLTETGGVIDWPEGFFDQGPDEAHRLLIAASDRRRGLDTGSNPT